MNASPASPSSSRPAAAEPSSAERYEEVARLLEKYDDAPWGRSAKAAAKLALELVDSGHPVPPGLLTRLTEIGAEFEGAAIVVVHPASGASLEQRAYVLRYGGLPTSRAATMAGEAGLPVEIYEALARGYRNNRVQEPLVTN